MHETAGYRSRHRLDLRRVMAFEADPRRWDKLWRRKSIPDRHQTVVSLLVDLPGSMHGPKTAAQAGLLRAFLEWRVMARSHSTGPETTRA